MSQPASAPSELARRPGGGLRMLLQLVLVAWLVFVSIATLVLNHPTIADPIGAMIGIPPEKLEMLRELFKRPDVFSS